MRKKERRYKKGNVSRTKKRILNVFIIFFSILFLFLIFSKTGAIFQTKTEGEAKLDIAFYCIEEDFQSMNLKLEDIVPRSASYIYNFTVSNNNGSKRTETALTYDLTLRTTTNLPLDFKLFDINSSPVQISTEVIGLDDDNTYFRTITVPQREFGFVNNETDSYRIEINFPAEYNLEHYQDIIELVEINVDSKQKI